MSELRINLVNNLPYESRLFIDGKEMIPQRDKKTRISEIVAETDKEFTEIRVENFFEARLPFWKWFLTTFVCWIISVFGIFDSVSGKTGRVVDLKLNVKTTENAFVKMKFNLYKKDGTVAQITETDTEVREITNIYRIDKQAKKRNKAYKIVRIISLIAVAIGVMFLASV